MTENIIENKKGNLNLLANFNWQSSDGRTQMISAPLQDVDITLKNGAFKFHCYFREMPDEVKNAFNVLLKDLEHAPDNEPHVVIAIAGEFWMKRYEGRTRSIVHKSAVGRAGSEISPMIDVVDIEGALELVETYSNHNDKRRLVFDEYAIDGSRI